MHAVPAPPRRVLIGDAAAFVGITPRAIRHYHHVGLLQERERGGDGRRRYGYAEVIRLLWIRRMTDAGIALDDIRDAFGGEAAMCTGSEDEVASVLERLDDALAAQELALQRKRASVRRMRDLGSRLGLLDELVCERLRGAPRGSLREEDLEALLVTERVLGPVVAAVQAGRFLALALDPELRADSDRVCAAEEELDDTVAVDDPRVKQVAAERHAFETRLMRYIAESGQLEKDDALLTALEASQPPDDATATVVREPSPTSRLTRAAETLRAMPYDFSPARVRCMEMAMDFAAATTSCSDTTDR
ncbi:MerR family transcriptional regulator [Rhodococcoides corynebacterioides]|uniref:helix-turn-helix domain-containing protein n=1 Tax=Rhodococcoides corynebacterioides TaxID=53972 RepID=UPI003F820ECA